MTTVNASEIRPGDTILPPKREVALWMRRHLSENGLPESALHLTVVSVEEAAPDKAGPWLVITTMHNDEWNAGKPDAYALRPFRFKARPATPWTMIRRGAPV